MDNPNEVRIDPSVQLADPALARALAQRQERCHRMLGARALAPWDPHGGRAHVKLSTAVSVSQTPEGGVQVMCYGGGGAGGSSSAEASQGSNGRTERRLRLVGKVLMPLP